MSANQTTELPATLGVGSTAVLDSKPTDPIKLMEELDAYLSFRLCCDAPQIPHSEILAIKKSIRAALESNNQASNPHHD